MFTHQGETGGDKTVTCKGALQILLNSECPLPSDLLFCLLLSGITLISVAGLQNDNGARGGGRGGNCDLIIRWGGSALRDGICVKHLN